MMLDMSIWKGYEMRSRGRMYTHTNDMLGPCLGREHTQDTSTASNIKHRLSLEEMGVIDDSSPVRPRPDRVFQHLFVNTYEKLSKCKNKGANWARIPKCA